MRRVAAEFEYVPLREAHVLKHLPRRVRKVFDLSIDKLNREIRDHTLEVYVRAAAPQQVKKVLAQCLIVIHLLCSLRSQRVSVKERQASGAGFSFTDTRHPIPDTRFI